MGSFAEENYPTQEEFEEVQRAIWNHLRLLDPSGDMVKVKELVCQHITDFVADRLRRAIVEEREACAIMAEDDDLPALAEAIRGRGQG